jgi:hypothetical protein
MPAGTRSKNVLTIYTLLVRVACQAMLCKVHSTLQRFSLLRKGMKH